MTTVEFLSLLQNAGVKIWIDSDKLGYRAPKGVMTADLKQELVERKTEILAFLKQAKKSQQLASEPIVPVKRDGDLPLSFPQQRMWFLYQLDRQSPFYNENLQLRIIGALNVAALEQSINEIIRRHEALRTIFPTVDGFAVQRILPALTVNIPVVNLQGLKEAEIEQIIIEEVRQPFDLSKPPLLRVTLLRLEPELYLLIVTIHHIIIDGWSVGIFIKELSALYQAFSTGSPTPLPELTIQYGDFTIWQRHWLTGEVLQTQLNYWRQQLKDIPTLLELPTDRPRPAVQSYKGAHLSIPLSAQLSEEIVWLSKRAGVTLFMTLLAAFQALLYRYTNSDDIVVGTSIANRNRQEIEGLIGFFVNTLVLRTDLSGNPSFEQLLGRVREVTVGAYAHQDLPFEELVEALQPERSLSYSPLFQVMFTLENTPACCLDLHQLTVSSLPVEIPTAKFDLTLSMKNTAFGLIGVWEYNTDLFDADSIARMAGHLQTILEAIVANPHQQISELPLLTEAERQQFLVEWNNTQTEFPQDKCIHQLFEAQVELTPNAVAVVFEGKQLTYQELNAKANQLARYLQSLGVKPDVLVGICVERSLLMIIGILGILKAGGAYIPLDPAYPPELLAFILEDSSVQVLLTQKQLVESLPKYKARILCLDTDSEVIFKHSEKNLSLEVMPNNLAYVIYTSGSTGSPKGVMIEHQSVVNLIATMRVEYGMVNRDSEALLRSPLALPKASADRVLQFSSISFDSATEEIYICLTSGATLVLRTDEMLSSVSTFLQTCWEWKVTVLELPTAYWHQIVAQLATTGERLPTSVRLVIFGGEAALPEKVRQWQTCVDQPWRRHQLGEPPLLINAYGPTEATVEATIYKFSCSQSAPTWSQVPIGRPIGNVQAYILDRYLQPVPIGVPGELHLGGVGLARGYLNRPELTAEKFIPHLFDDQPGTRLYKTGDLVRYLADGNIEYLGRIDHQVKIRGFRIELGEIETVLGQHPAVWESVVLVTENEPGDKRLVAYVVPKLEQFPTAQELRQFLANKLPLYMVPNTFVLLESLPLTPNGKLDRRALAKLELHSTLPEKFIAPRTPIEEMLAQIWAQVLKVELVGVNDNFFELGGHSLLAIQIISRIGEAFKVELPLRHLFEAPTIASLAQVIETVQKTGLQEQSDISMEFDTLPPLVPVPRDTHIPLSFAQQAIWYFQQLYTDSCAYNSPSALCFNGLLREEALEFSINEIIRRHEILRTTFTVVNEQPVQVIAPSLTLPLNIIDLQHLPQQEREVEAIRLSHQEAQHHFDLASDPLIKTTLLRLASQKHWLLIIMHHIITDGWSYDILLQELGTLYQAFSKGLPSPLPEVTIQYADFTVWQQRWFNEEVLEKKRSYWLQKLANFPTKLDLLPTFQADATSISKRASCYLVVLPHSQVVSIEALSHSQGVTIFSIILAALKILLYKLSGQTDIIILATTANRSTPEIEKMLGCFTNDVLLRDKIDSFQTGLTFTQQVNQTVVEALANQEIPLEKATETISESEIELFRTISVSMIPPVRSQGQILECEFVSIELEHELWDEKYLPLELYINSQTEDSKTIEIFGYYSTDLFTNETIDCLFNYYKEILHKLVEYPETKIFEF